MTDGASASGNVLAMLGDLDWATSYGYPGGLSLDALWEPPFDPQG